MDKIQPPVDVTDAVKFPTIAEACRHAQRLTPERRAELWK